MEDEADVGTSLIHTEKNPIEYRIFQQDAGYSDSG